MHYKRLSVFFLFVLILLICLTVPVNAATRGFVVATTPAETLNLVRVTTAATELPQIGAVSIESTPTGATVIIDGTVMGATPYTIRTLSSGTHSVLLQLNGYQDYSGTFVIYTNELNQQSYTLIPVPATTIPRQDVVAVITTLVPATSQIVAIQTAESPARTVPVTSLQTVPATLVTTFNPRPTATQPAVTPTIARPVYVPQVQAATLGEQLQALGPVTIQPLTVVVGDHKKSYMFDTLSPYFPHQFNTVDVIEPSGFHTPPKNTIGNFLEVDRNNVNLKKSHLMTSTEMTNDPSWADADTVFIAPTDLFYNDTNFRWISSDKEATAFYQVSRNPFSDNASEWQNQYVTGLVASGPAKDVYVDSENFHYFILNFAPIANHNVANPSYYTGTVKLDQTIPGQGKPMGLVTIPYTGTGFWYSSVMIGPVPVPVPKSFAQIAAGDLTEKDLGYPNKNIILSESDAFTPPASALGSMLSELDQTYYVRIVPIAKNGTAGIPAVPVTVTVKRPHPCPVESPGDVKSEILIKPPSAQITSFYMTLLIPDWIRTDQNGALVSRAHFVTVAPPPYCSAPVTGNTMMDSANVQFCSMYGGSEPGYHFYADPAESHWYDTVWDIIKGMFMALKTVTNSVSAAWAQINNIVVQIAAVAVQGLTFGAFDCSSSPACTGVLHAALSVAESSLGIPPTIPNVADLQSMGADYVAKVAADQLGAGGALDAAQSAYSAMPDSAKEAIKDNSDEIGENLGDSLAGQSSATMASAAGSFYIPDPLYYRPHPANVIVKITNPNNLETDPVSMTVKDTGGFYRAKTVMVPALKPFDSTVIPLILTEDFSKGYKPGCDNNAWTSTDGVPCYWDNWQQALRQSGTGKFVISYSVKKNGQWIDGLTPYSSNTVLSSQNVVTFDEQGNLCPGYKSTTVLKYPAGWKMQQTGFSQQFDSVMWNGYSFTEGARGRMISS